MDLVSRKKHTPRDAATGHHGEVFVSAQSKTKIFHMIIGRIDAA